MQRLFALDALRGLAAILVMVSHIKQEANADWYTGMAGLCVDFFLMLSGYVMARSYEHRLQTDMSAGTFLAKRFVRLWPVAALGVMLAVALVVIQGNFTLETAGMTAAALLFLPWIGGSWLFPLNSPRWSLFAELAINWFHAAALARRTTRQLLVVIAICAVPVVVSGAAIGDWPHAGHDGQFITGMTRLIVAYLIGVVLFRWLKDRRVIAMSLSGLCMVFAAAVYLGGLVHPPLFGPLFLFLLCPVLVAGGAGVVVPAKAWNWCTAAGALSYPLYAIHAPLAAMALYAGVPPWAVLAFALAMCAAIVALLAVRAPLVAGDKRVCASVA